MDKRRRLPRSPQLMRIIETSPLTAPKPSRPLKQLEVSGGGGSISRSSGSSSRKVKHRETRCLTVGQATDSETNSGGVFDICVEFVVKKCRRPEDAVVRGGGSGDGGVGGGIRGQEKQLVTAVNSCQLKVHSQSLLPDFGNSLAMDWTVARVVKPVSSQYAGAADWRSSRSKPAAEAASSTTCVSVQRSEDADTAAASVKSFYRASSRNGYECGTKKRLIQQNSSTTSRSVSQRLRELEILGRCLSKITSSGGPSEQLIRTRDHLLMLRSLTENALSIIGRYYPTPTQLSQQPSPPFSAPPLSPRAAVESRTFGSQQVQLSEAGAASVNTLDARTSAPPDAGAIKIRKQGVAVAAVRWQPGPSWDAAGSLLSGHWDRRESSCVRLSGAAPPEAYLRSCLARKPQRHASAGRIVSHSGRPPIVSRELFRDARFATVEIRPLRISAVDTLRPPTLPRLLAYLTEAAVVRLPPKQLASATEVPLSAPLYSVCALRRAVPAACNKRASHRVLHPRSQSCRASSRWLLATTQARAMAFGAAEAKLVTMSPAVTVETVPLAELVSAGGSPSSNSGGVNVTDYNVPSLCLRLAVMPMLSDSSARRLQPRILLSPKSPAGRLGRVDPASQIQSAASTAGLMPLLDEAEGKAEPEGGGNGDSAALTTDSGLAVSLNDACGDAINHVLVDKQERQTTAEDSMLGPQIVTHNTVSSDSV